jgi:ABC-type glycerol-3-phosphate transport system permease component
MTAIAADATRRRPAHPSRWVVTFLSAVLCAAWLVPLWILVITAMKTTPEYASNPSQWTLPENPLRILTNIRDAWTAAGLGPGFGASVIYGIVGAALAITFASLGAYSITRLRVRGAFFWFVFVFSGTMFPFQMYLIPLFRMYQTTGLYDTRVGMICFYTAISIPFCLLVMRGFFATIPNELQDAARVDGSGDFGILWRIFVPLAKGPVAVLFLFQFIWIWNDLLFGLVLSTSDGIRPITPSLAGLQGQYSASGPPLVMGGAIIATIPTVLLFLLLGRYLMQGLQLTAART